MGFHATHGSPFAPRADLHFQVTECGLMQAWHRDLYPKYGKSSTLMRQDGEYREKPNGCVVLQP